MIFSAAILGSLVFSQASQLQQSVTPGLPIQDPVAHEKLRVRIWKAALQDAYKPIKQNLIIDINKKEMTGNPPRLVLPGARIDLGVKGPVRERDIIRHSSGFLHRSPVRMKDGWAFRRERAFGTGMQANYEAVINWILSAPKPELKSMLSSGVPFTYLSESSQDIFARLCENHGLQKKMLNGEFASAELRFSFIGNYRDSKGSDSSMTLDLGSREWRSEEIRRNKLQMSYVPPQLDPGLFGRASVGELEFPEGEILTLDELSKLADAAFARTTIYDGRFGPQYVYIQGHFSKESFLKYMQAICKPIDFDYSLTAPELRDRLVKAMIDVLVPLADPATCPKGTSYQALFNGETVRGSDLFSGFEDLKSFMKGRNLPDSQLFRLSPGLTIQLVGEGGENDIGDPPGESPLSNSWGITFGKVLP